MKTIIAYLLFVAFSIQLAGNLITVAAFELNRDFIAKNLCINRDKPKSHCNGKCHLMKELKKEEKKNDSSGNSLKGKNETIQFFESTIEKLLVIESPFKVINFFYFENKTLNYCTSIFHPPLT